MGKRVLEHSPPPPRRRTHDYGSALNIPVHEAALAADVRVRRLYGDDVNVRCDCKGARDMWNDHEAALAEGVRVRRLYGDHVSARCDSQGVLLEVEDNGDLEVELDGIPDEADLDVASSLLTAGGVSRPSDFSFLLAFATLNDAPSPSSITRLGPSQLT